MEKKKISLTVSAIESLLIKDDSIKAEIAKLTKLSNVKEKQVAQLKDDRKAVNTALAKKIGESDSFFAAAVITISAQSPSGADNKLRQAMKRRRSRLIKVAESKFTDYDFETPKINNHIMVKPVYVGNENVREAKKIISQLQGFKEIGIVCTIPKQDKLVEMIADNKSRQEKATHIGSTLAIDDVTKLMEDAKTEQAKTQKVA